MKGFKKAVFSAIAGITIAGNLAPVTMSTVEAASDKGTGVTSEQIDNYIKKASLEQKIGQMYVSRTPQEPGKAEQDVKKYNLGGLIMYDADMVGLDQKQFKEKMDKYQAAANIPLLIGVDQEGGLVSRLTHSGLVAQNGNQFAFPRKQYSDAEKNEPGTGMSTVLKYATENATLLRDLGMNWNYAPDADYSNTESGFIYDRTFGGGSYQATADYIKQVVPAWQHDGLVAATLKHFPGYGDAADTHTGFATRTDSKEDIENKDMLPFKAGIEAGADSVMVTHVIYNQIDPDYPSSLSSKVISMIRNECNFDGVIVTDALEMGAITDFAKDHNNASVDVMAVKAGNDMIMTTDYATGIPEIADAVKKGEIPESQINASVKRILTMKNKIHLLSPENLKLKNEQAGNKNINMNSVSYNKEKKTALLSGTIEGSKKISVELKDSSTGEVLKDVDVTEEGTFLAEIPVKEDVQNIVVTVKDNKEYNPVNVTIKSLKELETAKTINVAPISYDKNKKQATISGSVSDEGAEGSMVISVVDADSGKVIKTTVVGGKGAFSVIVPIKEKQQNLKLISDDNSYQPALLTVKGLSDENNSSNNNTNIDNNASVNNGSIKVTPITSNNSTASGNKTPSNNSSTNQGINNISEEKISRVVMHKSNVYTKDLKVVGTKATYSRVLTLGNKITIKGKAYFRIGVDKYIRATNITGNLRKLTHNAYVYKNSGIRANKKVLHKNAEVRTYGGSINLHGKKYYRIGKNKYVKINNFKK